LYHRTAPALLLPAGIQVKEMVAMTHKGQTRMATRLLLLLVLGFTSVASAEWKEKVLYSFQGGMDGATPAGGVVFDQQGNLYGATTDGGATNCSPVAYCGTVYQLSPQPHGSWKESVLYVFKGKVYNDGELPAGGVIADASGNIYGTTAYGGTGGCVLTGVLGGCGTVYELSPPKTKDGKWTYKILYSFQSGKDGYLPVGDLVFDASGNLYGATNYGGGKGTTCDPVYQFCGTMFELSPPKTKGGKWTEKVLHGFAGGKDGANPNGGLVLDSKGSVYGTTYIGGYNCPRFQGVGCGTVFELDSPTKPGGAWTEKMIHRFTDGADGASPTASLTPAEDGSLYGSVAGGGKYQRGLIFHFVRTKSGKWTKRVLYNFIGNQGGQNPGSLILDATGNLYGGASGGLHLRGLIYKLKHSAHGTSWILADIYNFVGSPDGAGPEASLVFDGAGTLYSTTVGGGMSGNGTVFRIAP
jgi:uncharacterized repeat protein (TIGR03803 family)